MTTIPCVGLTVVVGNPGTGKTQRLLDMANCCVADGHPTFFVSIEHEKTRINNPDIQWRWVFGEDDVLGEVPDGAAVLIDEISYLTTLQYPTITVRDFVAKLKSEAKRRNIRLVGSLGLHPIEGAETTPQENLEPLADLLIYC